MKIRAPEAVWKLLNKHWETNKDNKHDEKWSTGNVYTNNWAAPTYMVNVENKGPLKEQIWDAAKDTIEQWTGMELQPTSMYGIRVYTEGRSRDELCL
jgi:prolyl 4-hydroxylase